MRSPQLRASSSRGSMRSALAQVCLLSASAPEATFAPFTASALKLLRAAAARLGAELPPYHVPAELRRCEGLMGPDGENGQPRVAHEVNRERVGGANKCCTKVLRF